MCFTPGERGGECGAGFRKVLPFIRLNFTNFVTLHQSKNSSIVLDFNLL